MQLRNAQQLPLCLPPKHFFILVNHVIVAVWWRSPPQLTPQQMFTAIRDHHPIIQYEVMLQVC